MLNENASNVAIYKPMEHEWGDQHLEMLLSATLEKVPVLSRGS